MDHNKHTIQGGIVSAPRFFGEGTSRFATVRVATTRRWRNAEGFQEKKTYHKLFVFGFNVDKLVGAVPGDIILAEGVAEDFEIPSKEEGKKRLERRLVVDVLSPPMRPTHRRTEGNNDRPREQQQAPAQGRGQNPDAPQSGNNGANSGQPSPSGQQQRQDARQQQPHQQAPSTAAGGGNEQFHPNHPNHPDAQHDRNRPIDDIPGGDESEGDEFSNMEEIVRSQGVNHGN